MHDIDRTQMEFSPELSGEFSPELSGEFSPELSGFETEEFEFLGEQGWGGEIVGEAVLTEADEVELANELLQVSNEAELDQFLGNLIKRAGQAVGTFVRSPVGQAIGGVLKAAAKKALPLAGGALGAWVGGPLGAKIGSGLASAAGRALGLEAEVLAQEELQFEGAKQFVRLGANAVRKTLVAPAGADPRAVAQAAAISAAKFLAPGLLGRPATLLAAAAAPRGWQQGRWVRRGSRIVLYGV